MQLYAEREGALQTTLHRVPFFLEPDYNAMSEDWSESHESRMCRKFGSKDAFERVKVAHRLMPRAAAAGLSAEGWTEARLAARVQSSTLRAHRLVLWVERTRGWEAAEECYRVLGTCHFVESKRLNDLTVLRSAAEAAGVDADAAEAYLCSSDGEAEVLAAVDAVSRHGIHSIPTLCVNGQLVISGAASSEEVLAALCNADSIGCRLFAVPPLKTA
mmetsp:Transcript_744/g.2029  ORF Transcript_744/g.2029 Transcript_744/m.2029 type:complete len:216 (-) Transcript_744:405-1052(-)